MLINDQGAFYCPLCKGWFRRSGYLDTVFSEPKLLWLSNMVCHYRHEHIMYYNRWVHYYSYHYNYEKFKTNVNNRAKRNIIRKCEDFLRYHRFTPQDFAELQNTDQKTLDLAHKILGGTPVYLDKPKKITTLDSFLD